MNNKIIEETENFQLVQDSQAKWEEAYSILNKKMGTIEVKGPSYATMIYYLVEAENGLTHATRLLGEYRDGNKFSNPPQHLDLQGLN